MTTSRTESASAVLTERRSTTLVVTLNRPEVRNAVNGALAHGVAVALDDLDADENLTAGVIAGAGDSFSAGMDLGAFLEGDMPFVEGRGFAGIAERASRKPLIAAIEGFAVGGGLEIALACDLIVAARGAKLGIPEVRHSVVAVGGALLRLPRRMPYHFVMELALTGTPAPAERFHDFGIVNRLVEPGGALDAALELADAVAENGPLALVASKRVLQEQWDWSAEEAWREQAAVAAIAIDSEDAREGASAFKEKRRPQWRGR